MLVLCSHRSIESILSSTTAIGKSKQYSYLKNWLGNGLLLSYGDYWRTHRKIITQAFHFKILERYVESFETASNVLVERLKVQMEHGEVFDVYPYINLCTLDIMCDTILGISTNAQSNSESDYTHSVREISRIVTARCFSVVKQHEFFYRLSKDFRDEKKYLKVVHDYAYKIIEKKRWENRSMITEEEISAKKKLDFLDLLLYQNQKCNTLSDEEIREEVDTFLFEGHETASSLISFTIYTLANHQSVQDKVYDEVRQILGENRCPNLSDLNRMKYLDMVIKETLRLYPPVPYFARELDTDIDLGDKIIPKGIMVTVFSIGIHRDPKVFPNPEQFDPERFSAENTLGRHPFAYIPFSAGSRNCIGQKFAMLAVKSVISKLLLNYIILPTVPKQEMGLLLELIMKPTNGVTIKLQRR